ncbi:MAG TPA: YkgJ family cysteine cluster protein [Pyrinomonadaceae bacterium]|jgi:Fe-S-cluster containining protein
MPLAKYDCLDCVGMCCSVYDHIPVHGRDLRRLARHLQSSVEVVARKFTKLSGGERILRRKDDPLLGRTCIFFDLENRGCGIYLGRPEVCKRWPTHGDGRCVYYDVLTFERRQQDDSTVIPLVQIKSMKR